MQPTILKQNPLIRAESVVKAQETIVYQCYTAKEHDLINAILFILQTRLFRKDSLDTLMQTNVEERWFTFQISELRKLAGFKDTAGGALKEVIDGIISKTFRLKQIITVDEEGKKIKKERIEALVKAADFYTYGRDNFVNLQLSRVFVALAHTEYSISCGNYTKVSISQISKINSKAGKRLFEFIKMRGNPNLLQLKESDLRMICGEQKHFSNYVQKIKQATTKLNNIGITFDILPTHKQFLDEERKLEINLSYH